MRECRRCGISVPDNKEERCWFCNGVLCYDCWDKEGHCGHKDAERAVRNTRKQLREELGLSRSMEDQSRLQGPSSDV